MAKSAFSKSELINKFEVQLNRIKSLCRQYDDGDSDAVLDLVVRFRVLFHNTDNSHSLLKQCKLDHHPIISSCGSYDPTSMANHTGLLGIIHLNDGTSIFSPNKLQQTLTPKKFDTWWNNEKILVTRNRNEIKKTSGEFVIFPDKDSFSRRSLILAIANTDGGAHIDSEGLKDNYNDLKRKFDYGLYFNDNSNYNGSHPLEPIKPSIRQIGYEVLETFENVNLFTTSKLYQKKGI